ncbi:MAG: FlgD immunoglobulin-like domain containing protein [Treponema sp.]
MNTFSSFKLKSYKLPHIILTAFLFFNAAHSYAAPYTWTGASSNDWHTAANWSPTGIPTINDNVTVSGVVSISAGDAEAKMLTIQNGLVELENVNLKLEKLICQGIGSFKGAGVSGNGTGTLKFTGSASFSTGSNNCTFANIEVDTGTALMLNSDITVKRNFVNNGAVTTATGNLTINGNYSGAGSLSASSITINFKGDVDFSQGTFSGSSRTVKLNGTASQKIKVNASGTDFGNLIIIDKASGGVTVEESEGKLKASAFQINSAPGGVTVNAPVNVAGILEHTGTGNAAFYKKVTLGTFKHSGSGTSDFSEEVVTANLEHTGNSTLTFQKIVTVSGSFTDSATSGALNFNGGANFTFTNQTEFKTNNALTLKGDCNFKGGIKRSGSGATNISGKITTADKAIDFLSLNNGVTLTSATVMETGSGNITFTKKVMGAPNKLEIKTSGTAKFNKGFDNNFVLHLTGNAEIKEDNTFSSFKVDNSSIAAATSVKFEGGKTQTINNSISLKGNAVSKPLTLGSTNSTKWNVYFSSVPTYEDFSYVVVDKSKSVDSGGNAHKLNLSQSDDYVKDSNYSPATTENWFSTDFYWKGTADSNWANAANWAYPDGNPRNHVPAHIGSTADVTIDTAAGGNDLELGNGIGSPLTTSLALKSLTVKADKRIGLGKCTINAADKIENKGTIALYGSQSAPVLSSPDTAHLPTSAIEYYGAEDGSDVLAITMPTPPVYTYKKLIVTKSAGKTMTFNNGISADSFDASVNAGKIIFNNGTVTTTGEQKYAGALELGADVTFTASKITFSATVDGSKALTIAGSAPTEFNRVVGNTAPLTSLTTGTGLTTINTSSIKTSGNQEYKGAVTLSENTALTASDVKFDSTVDGAKTLTIAGAASTEFNGIVGGTTPLTALTTGTGLTKINAASIKTSGSQTYNGKLELGANAKIQTVNAASVTFEETVNSASAGTNEFSLTIEGSAKPEFKKDVGLGAKGLAALKTGAGTETIINTDNIKTSVNQEYGGSVRLAKDTSLEGSLVKFANSLDGAFALTLAGATAQTFAGITGGTTPLTTLTTGTGLTAINAASIKTSGTQTYKGAVSLNQTASLEGSLVNFMSTLNGAFALTLAGGTAQTFSGIVGGTTPLSALTTGTGLTTIDTTSIKTSGTQTYNGAVSLNKSTSLEGSLVKFAGSLDGAFALTLAGATAQTFAGITGGTTPLTTLTTGTGLTTINAASIKTSGTQTYKGKLELGANAKIQTVTAAAVTFEETVNSASAGTSEYSLTISGLAKPEFKKDVGFGAKGLAALTTDTNTEAVINTSNIKTSGTQAYRGKVTLSKNTVLTAPASNIKFDGTVDGAQSLTIAGNAAVEFNNLVGRATPLTGLTTGTGLTTINTTSIKTSGIQTYKGAVSLNQTASLEGSLVNFMSTLNGAFALTLADATAQTFSGIVGGTTALSSLTTGTGTTTINTSSIKTNGIQTYKGKVILNTDSTLDSGSLMFEDAINSAASGLSGAKDLTLLCAGIQTFKNDIGNVHPLKSFTSGTGDIVLQCSSIKARAAQTYKGKLKLEHDVSLVSTAEAGGVILFESSVEDNAAYSLSVETGNDYIAFRLPSLMTGAKIQTGGSQTFKAAKGLRLLSESDFTWSAGGSGINLEPNTTDLYTDCAAAVKVTLASDLSCRNFYFYKGKFSAGSSKITSAKDFAVWGSNYNADDPRFSGTDTRFEFYTQLPLDYPVPTSKGAAFENLAGTQFIVGGNFYVNGTDLNDSSLTLTLPDNTSSKPVFNPNAAVTERQWGLPYAAAFNMSAANVTASRWIAAGGAQIQNVIDGGGNTNWQFDMPKIVDAYTVYDDVVYVKFNMDLENSYGEIATNLALADAPGATLPSGGVWYNGGTLAMLGAYSDPDCSSPIVNGDIPAAQGLYIKTNGGKWNTDATGTEAYGADSTTTLDSTDRSGVHQNVKTDLSFLEGIFTAANGHTMCRNYGIGLEGGTSAPSYTNVSDKCAPVLIKVYTGQEQHTAPDGTASMTNYDADSQKPYDAHNFIEFRYSEPVDTGALKLIDKTIDAKQINIKATGTFGAINNSSSSPKLSIEGIAKIANGSLQTGSLGNADNLVHSLYRKFSRTPGAVPAFESHRLRVAISGYADTVVSDGVKSYYNWQGYIDSAESPSGRITRVSDNKIKDKAGNTPDSTGTANHTLAQLSVESADDGLYGKWDVLPPVFASFMHRVRSDITGYEALGTANPGSTTLERLEFHLFDNAENDSDWYIKLGWSNDSGNNLVVSDAYGADIFGGSKPFVIPASGRTSGGIRYSSVYGKSSSFKYGIGADSEANTFFAAGNIKAGAQSLVFSPYTTPRHSSTQTDGLYISIDLPALSQLPFNTIFSVKYDDSGFVTDLAGNRMKTSTITTIDRSPPGFNMTVAAVKDPASSAEVFKELYVVFNKKLELNLIPIYDSLGTATAVNALEKIPACLRFIDSSTFSPISDISVVGVTEKFSNSNYTGLILKLNRTLTLEDIQSTYLQCYVADKSTDPLSGIPNTYVSYIQDHLGNYLPNFSAHPISDFAVNVVQPVYAYDDRYAGTGGSDMTDIFDSSVAAYDWNEEQRKLGTLIMEHDISIYAKFNDGAQQTPASVNVNAYFDLVSQLTPGALSVNYNKNTSDVMDWRVWLPNKNFNMAVTPFLVLSPELNDINKTSVITLSGEYRGDNKPLIFNLPYKGGTSISTAGWSSGDQISFLFGLADTGNIPIKIRHNPVWDEHTSTYTGDESPLFALRLKNPSDITSVDLWSFKMQKQKSQRGGVTVLNNVINALKAEKMTLQVDMPSAGSLNVIIMTLDGDIVKYLHHGQAESGSHYFTWDGTTKNGGLTARGLYFIRVFGNGIDETRKVMVVKD